MVKPSLFSTLFAYSMPVFITVFFLEFPIFPVAGVSQDSAHSSKMALGNLTCSGEPSATS